MRYKKKYPLNRKKKACNKIIKEERVQFRKGKKGKRSPVIGRINAAIKRKNQGEGNNELRMQGGWGEAKGVVQSRNDGGAERPRATRGRKKKAKGMCALGGGQVERLRTTADCIKR